MKTISLRSLLNHSEIATKYPEPVAAAKKELDEISRPIILPAKAYIHTLDELSHMVGRIYEVPACTKHGNRAMKICGACGRVACSGCEPLFCRCQAEQAKL